MVEKAGEVIPYVRQAVPEKRPKGAKPIEPPTKCPSCGSKVVEGSEDPRLSVAIIPNAPPSSASGLRWFCGRGQMDIENIGEALVDQLIDAGLVKTFADLYRVTKEQILELERMGDKSAQNVIDAIAESKSRPLDRLLAGLGIRHVGNRVAFVLAENFGDLSALQEATVERAFVDPRNRRGDRPIGLRFLPQRRRRKNNSRTETRRRQSQNGKAPAGTAAAGGQTVVVTGALKRFKRDEIERLITDLGGRSAGSVSSKTSFVVAGEEAGSKLAKAKELGVEVLSESEFLKRIGRDYREGAKDAKSTKENQA